MVRHKNRYIVTSISHINKDEDAALILKPASLYLAINDKVQQLYGDFGVAAIRAGFTAKYCNERTRIAVIRVRHGPHRFVTSSLPCIKTVENKQMEMNCEFSKPPAYPIDKLYCQGENYQNNVCSSQAFQEKIDKIEVGNNNKLFDLLSVIMKANTHHLEMFKAKHFSVSYDCRAENAIKIFFGWSVGVNIKELSEYLDISEDVVKHFYLMSTLYAKQYIKNHIVEWKIGGPGVITLLDVYPCGCNKFNFTSRNNENNVFCIAEVKEIPPRFWFQILNQTDLNQRNNEILEAIFTIVRPGSILVIDLDSTGISDATYSKLKNNYRIVVHLESLERHNTESQSLLSNLETIWRPALDICEFANYQNDIGSYYTSFLWNQRFGLPLPGAIPLLPDAGTFGCSVSRLARCAPPWPTWPPPDSSGSTILTPGLAWTPSQREMPYARTPDLKPSAESDLQVAGLQECATLPVEIFVIKTEG
ncbi:hypothetical protein Trydic_g10490 [Trypoxylus dichotomus]